MKDIRVDNWMENAERAGADLIANFYTTLGVPEPTVPFNLEELRDVCAEEELGALDVCADTPDVN